MQMLYRTASAGDIDALVELVQSAYRGERSRAGWTTEADLLDGRRTDAPMVAAAIADPAGVVLVAEADGTPVACCQLERRDGYAYFGMFAVEPERQRGGLGAALLAEAERYARAEWGTHEMRMTVIVQREELIAWYVRRGYRRTGELTPFPYGDERVGLPRRPDLAFETLVKPFGGPRLAPVEPPYDAETAEALTALGPPIALFRVLARRPDRARAVHGWGSYYLSRRTALTLRQRELVIDRVTALCGAEYELRIHLDAFAAKAALTDAQVASLTAGSPADPCWTDPADAALLRAVDALHARHDLTDTEWSDLLAATGEEGAIDAILVCGWYHAISFLARAARLPLEP